MRRKKKRHTCATVQACKPILAQIHQQSKCIVVNIKFFPFNFIYAVSLKYIVLRVVVYYTTVFAHICVQRTLCKLEKDKYLHQQKEKYKQFTNLEIK